MKKILVFVLSSLLLFSIISCKDNKLSNSGKARNKATTLAELQKKFEGYKFKNCDQGIAFILESFDVYFATIDRALEGDEQAKKDVEDFNAYFDSVETEADKIEKRCPEKVDAIKDELQNKLDEYYPKLFELYDLNVIIDEEEAPE